MDRQLSRRRSVLPSEAEQPAQTRPRASHARRIRRKRRVLIGVVAGLVLVLGVGGWVGVRGLIAKAELEAAIPLANRIKDNLLDNDPERASALLRDLQEHTTVAVELTGDPVWRVTELFPFLGSNLTAFREAAEVVALVADEGLGPVVELARTVDISSFKPIDGQIQLDPIIDATVSVVKADDVVTEALEATRRINTTFTIGPVTDAVVELEAVLDDASNTLDTARTMIELAPGMLGVDGPRNYLLMFQNPAEARSLGGNPASFALVTVDDGRVDMVAQASSQDFQRGVPPYALPAELSELYSTDVPIGDLEGWIQNVTFFADFSVAASLAKAMWERDIGPPIDAVVSIDPVALSYILAATGSVTLSTGDVLSGDSAVPLLLSEVYTRYPTNDEQDAFFASAAQAVFDQVKSGSGESKDLVNALTKSVEERRLLIWSTLPEEQSVIETTTLSGILPTSNEPETVIGAFFNGYSNSKLNYYADMAIGVNAPVCEPGGFTSLTSVTVRSQAPLDISTYPRHVTGGSDLDGGFTYDVVVIGPVGATYESFESSDSRAYLANSGYQDGRPVARIRARTEPGDYTTITVKMTSPDGDYGPLKVVKTPLAREIPVTYAEVGCPSPE